MPKSTLKKENLPAGVGRVPGWWMELTPHYLLDLEDDEKRRQQDFQEMIFFARMAAEDDEKTRGERKSNWQGRSANGGSSGSGCDVGLFGGRNFQPGSNGWDPKEWGISENDPDYKSYLSGANLPQSYIDAMKEYAGRSGIQYDASNLHQTEYGKYGRQAEKPAFTPSWAKQKLRSTGQGSAIRQGVYTDSPNKHLQPKVNAVASKFEGDLAESTDPSNEPATPERVAFVPTQAPVTPTHVTPTHVTPTHVTPTHVTKAHVATTPVYNQPIEHTYTAMPVKMDPRETQPEEEPEQEQDKKFNFNDYYYNAKNDTPALVKHEQAPEQAPQPEEEDSEQEYEEVVEYVEEYEEGDEVLEEYVEEYIEEYEEEYEEEEQPAPAAANVGIADLQALLAAKQAELARLQAA